ncbi:hypothetical protein ACFL0W_02730 [Nanoarchaeota archaeon]
MGIFETTEEFGEFYSRLAEENGFEKANIIRNKKAEIEYNLENGSGGGIFINGNRLITDDPLIYFLIHTGDLYEIPDKKNSPERVMERMEEIVRKRDVMIEKGYRGTFYSEGVAIGYEYRRKVRGINHLKTILLDFYFT